MEKIVKKFNTYAEKILNNSVLKVKNKTYRICEIEMYYCSDEHIVTNCNWKMVNFMLTGSKMEHTKLEHINAWI